MNPKDRAYAALVATKIRDEIRRQRRTQRGVADDLGWNELLLSRRINPEGAQFTEVTIIELARIADALGVPVATFIPGASVTRPTT